MLEWQEEFSGPFPVSPPPHPGAHFATRSRSSMWQEEFSGPLLLSPSGQLPTLPLRITAYTSSMINISSAWGAKSQHLVITAPGQVEEGTGTSQRTEQ